MIAAQVMQMVEAGELGLDDPAADHFPSDLDFDSNGATVRQLLGMRSGSPHFGAILDSVETDRQRRWTPTDVLALVAADRSPAGDLFEYSSTNYVLLGLIIEQVRGRVVADVLRDGVLDAVEDMERLIYQPDEVPDRADGDARRRVERRGRGGRRPPAVTRGGQQQAARRTACHRASLTEMATFDDGYGIGLYEIADPYASGVGHAGQHIGFVSWAVRLPADGLVVVVLSNGLVDISAIAIALVDTLFRRTRGWSCAGSATRASLAGPPSGHR